MSTDERIEKRIAELEDALKERMRIADIEISAIRLSINELKLLLEPEQSGDESEG